MLRKTFIPVLVSAVLTLALACSQNDGRICDPRCEYAENPIGIDVVPRFTWEYDAPGFVQEGYRITVSSSKERLETPDIWDSGIVKGNDPSAVFPQDTPLESFSRYYWKVTAYGSGGKEIESGVSWFETAMMNQSDWTAEWISDNLGKDAEAAPMFRKSFTAESGLQRAKLYISAVAYSRTRINGKPVSDNMLDPGYTHYDRRNLYSVLDVTDLIDKGENVISAVLGNGFYNEIKPVARMSSPPTVHGRQLPTGRISPITYTAGTHTMQGKRSKDGNSPDSTTPHGTMPKRQRPLPGC